MKESQKRRCHALVTRQMQAYDTSGPSQSLGNVPQHEFCQVRLAQVQVYQCLVALDHCANVIDNGKMLRCMRALRVLLLQQEFIVAVETFLSFLLCFIYDDWSPTS